MYNITKTDEFGPNGMQLNFYVDNNLGNEELYIYAPNNKGLVNAGYFTEKWGNESFPIFSQILYLNELLKEIYKSNSLIFEEEKDINELGKEIEKKVKKHQNKSIPTNEFNEIQKLVSEINNSIKKHKLKQKEFLFINLRIQNFVYMLNKVLLLFVFTIEKKYFEKNKPKKYNFIKNIGDFLSRRNKSEFSEIYKEINESLTSIQLFEIISALNDIYQSQNMLNANRLLGPNQPIIVAVEPYNKDGYDYVFHNHSIQQVVLAFNNFLKDMGFYNE